MDGTISHSHYAIVHWLEGLARWARFMSRLLLVISILLMILTPSAPVFAQGEGPDNNVDGAAGKMIGILSSLGKLFIQVAYALMFIVFAVGSVKNGLGAQLAQQFGATGRVASELMSLVIGLVIFVFALMTLPLANRIAGEVSQQFIAGGGWNFEIANPVPLPGE